MKASLKLRENQDPILKSKIPIKIFTFPFRSSIEASGDPKELCLSFSSFWASGPLFKLNYRPNDPSRPFGLVLKTGFGSFGSPLGAPFTIGVECNFPLNNSCNKSPNCFINFKPRIGDFTIRRRIISEIQIPSRGSQDLVPVVNNQNGGVLENRSDEAIEKMRWTELISSCFAAAEGLVGKEEVCARTVMPVMDWAAVNLRWGLRFPAAEEDGGGNKIPMPFFVLNKIWIEQIARGKIGRDRDLRENEGGRGGDVAEACLDARKELLKKDFETFFKSVICGWKFEKNGRITEK